MTYKRKSLLIKIIVLAFAALIALFPLEDSPSLETKTAVNVIAFDKQGESTQIFVQMNIPQQMAQGSSKLLVVEEEGNNIAEAFEKLSIKIGQEIELAHCGIIIIGEDMAHKGFVDDLNYLLAGGMISPQITIFNCEGNAEDFMSTLNKFSQTNGSAIFDVVKFSEKSINLRTVTALTFLAENNLPSNASTLPLIDFEIQEGDGSQGGYDSGESQNSSGNSGQGSTSSEQSENESPELKELNMSMVYKNGIAVGKISEKGTKGISIFDEKSNKGYLEVSDVKVGEDVISYVPMQVRKKRGVLKAEFREGKPIITAEIDVMLEIETSFNISKVGKNISQKEVKEAIADKIRQIMQSEIEEALELSRKFDADILGIQNAFYKQQYTQYKFYASKDEIVKNVQVEYKINADVT
ncbi:MAG: hypothetical protein IKC35_04645 [Clostridia bacterium]|nr:hypothetical protein [Clostridia bacterium]